MDYISKNMEDEFVKIFDIEYLLLDYYEFI